MPSPTTQVEVLPARSPRRFLDLQRRFYRGDPHYVPPLTLADSWQVDRRKNPFFEHGEAEFWIAQRDGVPVGRISAARDALHDEFHGDRVGFFGHFEAGDQDAAHALLDRAATWLQEHDAEVMRGPIDLSTNYRTGLLIGGEPGPPVLMMPYNPPEYADYLESYGLARAKDLLALMLELRVATPQRFERVVDRIVKRTGARIRQLDIKRFDAEMDIVWRLYNQIWERNWGFVPMSEGEFRRTAKELKIVADPELLIIVEVEDRPVAFGMCLPDVNMAITACNGRLLPFGWFKFLRGLKRIDRTRVLTLGVLPEYRKNGLDALMVHYYYKACPATGHPQCEASWILEDNQEMIRVLESLGGREYRRYRLYEKPL